MRRKKTYLQIGVVDDIPHVGVLDTYRPLKGINGSQVRLMFHVNN